MRKKGVDVSRYNTSVNYKQLKSLGYKFVIPRCGAGHSGNCEYALDPMFLDHVAKAKEAGLEIPGVYHWIEGRGVEDAIKCADQAIQNVKKAGLSNDAVIWCDLEFTPEQQKERGLSNTDLKKMAEAFCNYLIVEGYPTGVYTNQAYMLLVYGTDFNKFYDIWLSDLEGEPGYECVYRQTGAENIPGVGFTDINEYYGNYTAGTAKPHCQGKEVVKLGKYQIHEEKKLVSDLKSLARDVSLYQNYFPANLLLWSLLNGKMRWSADCHNLYKALFNGRDITDKTPGSFAWPLTATGDCTEYGLLIQCSDVQWENFKTLKDGEFRLLYMKGHVGGYLGEEWNELGQGIVNCVESTPRWEDGIQFSYIDKNTGARSWAKGTTICGYWEAHGLASKWVIYDDSETQKVVEKDKATVDPVVATSGIHFGTTDLAVAIIRNNFGKGYQNRVNNAKALGYTEAEVRKAQDLVNVVVERANDEKTKAEKALTIINAAYDVIAGKYGDGIERKTALIKEFGEEYYGFIQDKVDELLT